MDLTRALQRMVRRYPGGSPALAAMLEMSPTTLAHKANPADARQWFSPEECLALTEATNDNDFINSFCAARGGLYLPEEPTDLQALSDGELAAVMREASELVIACTKAKDENGPGGSAVTENEKAEVLKEVSHLIAAAQEVYRRFCAEHEATKPRHLRAA